jgi:hypothetical protein
MHLGLRVKRALLQTAVRTLYRQRDGRTITLVGTCHIGWRTYYLDLHDQICWLEDKGAQVHCEGSNVQESDPDAAPPTAEELEVLALHQRADDLTARRVREVLGWVRQRDALVREDTWLNFDIPIAEVHQRAGLEQTRANNLARIAAMDWPDGDTIAALTWRVHTTDYLRRTAAPLRSVQQRINAGQPSVVVNDRRRNAIGHALTAAGQGHDVAMVWGAAHQPAMIDDLAEHGFRRTGPVTWHTVGELPTLWQRLTYVRYIRAARKTGLQHDTGPDDTAGITTRTPGWVEEMNEPEPAPQAVDLSATAGGNPKEAGRRR